MVVRVRIKMNEPFFFATFLYFHPFMLCCAQVGPSSSQFVFHFIVVQCKALLCIAMDCTVLQYIAFYSIALHCIALNRPFLSSKIYHFQNEAKCKTNVVKMSFIYIRIKNHFHINGFALSLPLKQRLEATGECPIVPYKRVSIASVLITTLMINMPEPPNLRIHLFWRWSLRGHDGSGRTYRP